MANTKPIPTIPLSDGYEIPQLGFGTWSVQSPPGEMYQAVKYAISVGYRHIDAAYCYGNEEEVGQAIREKIEDGTVKRSELFITSKLWNTFHREDLVAKGFELSLQALGLDYMDLYLMHWPYAFKEEQGRFPKDEDGKFIYSDAGYIEAWKEMEKIQQSGKVRSIGLCSFNSEQLQSVLDIAKVKPVVLQIEINPFIKQTKLINFARERGMTIIGFSPLGSPDRAWAKEDDPHLLSNPMVKKIAAKHKISTALTALRWSIQRGNILIPKSVYENEIMENRTVFNYVLEDEDMAELNSFPEGYFRGIRQPQISHYIALLYWLHWLSVPVRSLSDYNKSISKLLPGKGVYEQ